MDRPLTVARQFLPPFLGAITLIFYLGNALASPTCLSLFADPEASGAARIEAFDKIIVTNGKRGKTSASFSTTRGWPSYLAAMTERVFVGNQIIAVDRATPIFEKLTAKDVILDAGCGDTFLADMLFEGRETGPFRGRSDSDMPHYSGVTYALNQRSLADLAPRIASPRFTLRMGEYFENLRREDYLPAGKDVKVITDYYGILSYTHAPHIVLKAYLEVLHRDGAMIIAADPRISFPKTKGLYDFASYLRTIPGLRVEWLRGAESTLIITLTGEPIVIPELEMTSHRDPGTLPLIRYFRLTGRTATIVK